jgi:hypothetical protein
MTQENSIDEKQLNAELENIMARTLHVCAFADMCDELDQPVGGGGDYMDVAGETPNSYRYESAFLVGKIEHLNNETIGQMYLRALDEGNYPDTDKNRRDFGHYMVMESLGHGVAWSDDHVKFEHNLPYFQEMIATPSKQSIMDNTDFSPESLDPADEKENDQLAKFNDLNEIDSPNHFYLATAVGIAKGIVASGLPDTGTVEAKKALMLSNLIKNDDVILAGCRILGATFEADSVRTWSMKNSEEGTQGQAFKIHPQDLSKYKSAFGDNTDKYERAGILGTEGRIMAGQRMHDFVVKGETYESMPDAKSPRLPRDLSPIVETIVKAAKPNGPSLSI